MDKKAFIFICAGLVIFSLAVWGWGCSKKPQPSEVSEAPLGAPNASAPTDLIVVNPTTPSSSTLTSPMQVSPATLPAPQTSVPPAMSEEEKRLAHNKDIQTALKNAGFYNGEVDGRLGPATRKAIKDFQTSKGLTADGKVGPKTWAELEQYLNPPTEGKKSKKKK